MRAVIVQQPGQFQVVEDRPIPTAGDGQVVIRVDYAAICGSDRIYWETDLMLGRSLGHEFAGTIHDPGTSDFQVGERVAAMELNPCGKCPACRAGRPNICPSLMSDSPGISVDGGQAEYVAVRQDMVRRVPQGVSQKLAAIAEPVSVAYHGVRRADIRGGERVLVIGAGPIGVFAAACAKAAGAAYVAVADQNDKRLELAQRQPFIDQVLDVRSADYRAQLKAAEPEKFALILECTGTQGGVGSALGSIRNGGRLVTLGIHDNVQEIDTLKLLLKEIELVPSAFFTPEEFTQVLEWMASGKLDLEGCITDIRGFSQAQASFEEVFARGNYTQLKILLDPRA